MPNYRATSEGNVPFTAEEELQWAADQAAWAASANTRKAAEVRQQRDTKLSATDWRYRRDRTTTPEWDAYCQALRDVPSQAGFPWTITWPDAP